MKVALGTIEVSDYQRRALAHRYGEPGLASRELVRRFVVSNGQLALVEDIPADYEAWLDDQENRPARSET
jgi:NADH:ubiquinone oxidoreductase subunit